MIFHIIFRIVFFPAWAAFAWWSWRAVRRRGFAPRYGMTLFGGAMFLTLAIQQCLDRVDADMGDALWMPGFWRRLPLQLFIALPIAVWADYFFNKGLWWVLGSIAIRPRPEE
jgi:hypothetical protein